MPIHCSTSSYSFDESIKESGRFFIKPNIYLPYDSAIPFLAIKSREICPQTYVHNKTLTKMFISGLLSQVSINKKQDNYV